MDETFFFTVFEGLPRQGPGSDTCTARAFNLIPDLPGHTCILDIGCGSGMQTLALAKLCPGATITACDIYQPFLDDLSERAKNAGLDTRIKTMRASMENLPFPEKSVDLIWAEGSAFIMGFKEALHCWRRFLKPHGYVAFSDCVWFTKKPSDECREYFNEHYPAMIHEQDATTLIGEAGYTVLDILRLPDAAWWDHYYTPLSLKLEILIQQYKDDQEVLELLNSFVQEIQVFRNHSKEYGYSFFIIRKEDE